VEVNVPGDDPLAWSAGSHAGTVVGSARVVMGPATKGRVPRMPAPCGRPAAEPALSWGGDPGD
ncbi:MAG: hypothetical protein LC808_31530, partial [Actinobacteria bacterium]|nr:hypothetical protein [Actinomycetota bacterium]